MSNALENMLRESLWARALTDDELDTSSRSRTSAWCRPAASSCGAASRPIIGSA